MLGAHDAFDDGQAQPGAGSSGARCFAAREGQFQALDLAGGDTRTAIRDGNEDFSAGLRQREFNRFCRAGMAQGVFDQVDDGAAQRRGAGRGQRGKVGAGGTAYFIAIATGDVA